MIHIGLELENPTAPQALTHFTKTTTCFQDNAKMTTLCWLPGETGQPAELVSGDLPLRVSQFRQADLDFRRLLHPSPRLLEVGAALGVEDGDDLAATLVVGTGLESDTIEGQCEVVLHRSWAALEALVDRTRLLEQPFTGEEDDPSSGVIHDHADSLADEPEPLLVLHLLHLAPDLYTLGHTPRSVTPIRSLDRPRAHGVQRYTGYNAKVSKCQRYGHLISRSILYLFIFSSNMQYFLHLTSVSVIYAAYGYLGNYILDVTIHP